MPGALGPPDQPPKNRLAAAIYCRETQATLWAALSALHRKPPLLLTSSNFHAFLCDPVAHLRSIERFQTSRLNHSRSVWQCFMRARRADTVSAKAHTHMSSRYIAYMYITPHGISAVVAPLGDTSDVISPFQYFLGC